MKCVLALLSMVVEWGAIFGAVGLIRWLDGFWWTVLVVWIFSNLAVGWITQRKRMFGF